jgi:hypothetical protein
MADTRNSCTVCDRRISVWSGDTRCSRCEEACPECGGDVAYCRHPLSEQLTETVSDPLLKRRAA